MTHIVIRMCTDIVFECRDLTFCTLIWCWYHGGTTEEGNCSYLLPLSHRGYHYSIFVRIVYGFLKWWDHLYSYGCCMPIPLQGRYMIWFICIYISYACISPKIWTQFSCTSVCLGFVISSQWFYIIHFSIYFNFVSSTLGQWYDSLFCLKLSLLVWHISSYSNRYCIFALCYYRWSSRIWNSWQNPLQMIMATYLHRQFFSCVMIRFGVFNSIWFMFIWLEQIDVTHDHD